ncbi:MAG: hypothetical protein IJT73_06375, partial [Selenomonadaceae bacterium]|nr:hypothetical protein [Selenomonadaceae bacterium]
DNYGHITPLFIEKIFEYGKDFLREQYKIITDSFAKAHSDILPEYQRYIAVITLADTVLDICLGVDEETALSNAVKNALKILRLIPTITEIDDTTREINSIKGFIAENQSRFIGGNVDTDKIQKFYGTIESDCIYITVAAMKQACTDGGFNYDKVVTDLITAGVILPSNKIKKGYKNPLKTFQKKLGKTNSDCYKIVFSDSE